MDIEAFFLERGITGSEALRFFNILKNFHITYGSQACWCLRNVENHAAVEGFTTSQNSRPRYMGTDARELLLASIGQSYSESTPIIVRYGHCKSTYCINPSHYFFGTRQDAMAQHNIRNGSGVNHELIAKLREDRSATKKSYASLAKEYMLPYHTVRRICTNETFA